MRFSFYQHIDEKLVEFLEKQWDNTMSLHSKFSLRKKYSLSEAECEDVFQNSLMILLKNIKEKKIDSENLCMSSPAYFYKICRNKTRELDRSKRKFIKISSDINPGKDHLDYQDEQVEKILSMDDENENLQKRKEALVRDIVKDLPSPCNELLWGYYGDGYSMKMLAEMFDYASVNAVKVTKHRCCEKFRKRYSEMVKSLL